MIRIIGTSHISQQSINEIKAAVSSDRPDIIALELDVKRAMSLASNQKRSRIGLRELRFIGLKGFIFAKIGQIVQEKLGKMVGVKPGSEMKSALILAKKEKIKIALIDQPIEITLQNFSRELTWKERLRFFGDIILGIFFPRRQIRKMGLTSFDLRSVPEEKLLNKLMKEFKKRYPTVHKTLVDDRNKFMVKALREISTKNPQAKILAIVGAGHKKDMGKMLKKRI